MIDIQKIVEQKSELIELKKAQLKCADSVGFAHGEVVKAINTSYTDNFELGQIKRTLIANTYNWLDSHGDVHVGNTFGKSISEKSTDKIFHLHDHEHKVTAKVGKFEKIYEKSVSWSDLGVNKAGSTTVLMADSNISKAMNEQVFDMYLKGEIDQHSVGMRYIKIDLAVNSTEYPEEKAVWDMYIDQIGNKEKAIEQGYFWAVKEAALFEISAVLMGSNELTPTVENIEPSNDTQTNEPLKSTQGNNAIDWQQVVSKF
jgi:hypothetical protein